MEGKKTPLKGSKGAVIPGVFTTENVTLSSYDPQWHGKVFESYKTPGTYVRRTRNPGSMANNGSNPWYELRLNSVDEAAHIASLGSSATPTVTPGTEDRVDTGSEEQSALLSSGRVDSGVSSTAGGASQSLLLSDEEEKKRLGGLSTWST